jgi:hypothetical protein
MKHGLPLLICLCLHFTVYASGDPFPMGARAWGMGNATLTVSDGWAVFNNISGLAGVQHRNILVAYDNRYGVSGFQTMAIGYIHPLRYGTLGVSLNRFGDNLYNEHKLGVAFSHQLDRVSLGLKINYVQFAIDELGSRSRILFEFGGITTITSQLSFGAYIYNFNQAKLADYQDERIPTVMRAGLSYHPIAKLMLNAEVEKDVDFPATVKVGLEYEVVKHLYLRTGVTTKPFVNHLGLGFVKNKFQFDYAARTHPILGLSHHLSVGYRIEKKKKDA